MSQCGFSSGWNGFFLFVFPLKTNTVCTAPLFSNALTQEDQMISPEPVSYSFITNSTAVKCLSGADDWAIVSQICSFVCSKEGRNYIFSLLPVTLLIHLYLFFCWALEISAVEMSVSSEYKLDGTWFVGLKASKQHTHQQGLWTEIMTWFLIIIHRPSFDRSIR